MFFSSVSLSCLVHLCICISEFTVAVIFTELLQLSSSAKKLLFWADTFTLTLEFLTTPCAASFKLEMRKGMTNFPKNNKKGILAVLFL